MSLTESLRRFTHRLRSARNGSHSPWDAILAASALPEGNGTSVLLATSVGSHPVAPVVDGLVGAALAHRGARPRFLLCDGALPACEACAYIEFSKQTEFVEHGPLRRLCGRCVQSGKHYLAPLGLPLHQYSEFVSPTEAARCLWRAREMSVEECFLFEDDGLRLGEQTRAATVRYFGKADLESEPDDLTKATAQRYAAGAMVAAMVAERILDQLEPEVVVAHHGVYVPQGVIGEVARKLGVRVANWGVSYRNTTLIYSHDDTYHRTMISEPIEAWDRPLSSEQEADLLGYLAERRVGKGDWTWVTPEAALRVEHQERDRLVRELQLDTERPIFGLLTNVLWDAQLYYASNAFADMLDWLWMTLDFFARRPDLQLIVRIHPHEVKHGNRQPAEAEIRKRYGELPENIKIVSYDNSYNTYSLMGLCDAVLIYGTKTGVELAPLGIPVVIAGDAWVRGKGLTHDVSSAGEYAHLLERLPEIERLDDETTARARSYAYHYFFRRMIPLRSLDPDGGIPPELQVRSLSDLDPGRDPGLDVICEGILTGSPFVFDA